MQIITVKNMLKEIAILVALITTFGCLFAYRPAQAEELRYERIEHFNSSITVEENGSLRVVERIQVYATGESIDHGIYRDFPTTYKDRYGNKMRVGFEVLGVKRNGTNEPYHIERKTNGKRVYFGSAEVSIPGGFHDYEFTYRATRELGFFEDHDELYWNVTGNGWSLPIRQVVAEVFLPETISHTNVTLEGYTGRTGEQGKNFFSNLDATNLRFETLSELAAGEGLSIVVSWPKGYIQPPTTKQKIVWFLSDNKGVLLTGILLVILFSYYIRTWRKHGMDPEKGTIVPHYESPRKLSSAGISYVQNMGYRANALTAAILALAVKGYVHITDNDGTYHISKLQAKGKDASQDERAVYEALFTDSTDIVLKQSEYSTLQKAQHAQQKALKEELGGGKYFVSNTKYFIFGLLLSIAVIVTSIVTQSPAYVIVLAIILSIITDILFYILLYRRTENGQKLYEEIQGFKLYMSVAEKERLNFHNPPEQTPQLFEKLLPFALALGIEHKWAEQFTSVFKGLGPEGSSNYTPLWYTGSSFSASKITDFSGSLSSAISSSSTPPGGSSGSGGGSSGGGGGGGGGGGW